MRYSISRVQKILGISQSTLRRYEDAGFWDVRCLPGSKYRFFSMGDIARLSVFLGMRQQGFLPQELGKIAEKEDEAAYVYARITDIESRIKSLEAEKICWEKHLKLCKLMNELKEKPENGILIRFEALIGSYFFDEESMYNALFFHMLREGITERNYFRLCCFFSQETHKNNGAEYRQAYCMPLEMIKPKDVLDIKNQVLLPEREYIAAYAPNLSIIDEEKPDAVKKAVATIHIKTKKLLDDFGREQDGDAMTMTVTVSGDTHEAILLIPVKPA